MKTVFICEVHHSLGVHISVHDEASEAVEKANSILLNDALDVFSAVVTTAEYQFNKINK